MTSLLDRLLTKLHAKTPNVVLTRETVEEVVRELERLPYANYLNGASLLAKHPAPYAAPPSSPPLDMYAIYHARPTTPSEEA